MKPKPNKNPPTGQIARVTWYGFVRLAAVPAWCLTAVLMTGCGTPAGARYTYSPDAHKLMETTKAVRQRESPLPLPRELDKHPLPSYTVEPGDVLLVLVSETETASPEPGAPADKNPPAPVRIPADQPILPDGSINLGPYGRLIVAGKTVEEMETMIRATVQAHIKRDPGFVTVRIVTRESKVYYVLGEVNTPGAFQLKGRETVLDGLLAAGGLNERASRDNIILTRPTAPESCRIVLPVCYREITQLGDTTTNYQLMPGDRILVPTREHHEKLGSKKNCRWCDGSPQVSCPMPATTKAPGDETAVGKHPSWDDSSLPVISADQNRIAPPH